ncbi:MAG: acyl-CoA dehydrogenase, partial [Rhodospirillaceae bacterium]|nr:acyl-CoA dehydrogenase [Rhodospirillaceae bacterium]
MNDSPTPVTPEADARVKAALSLTDWLSRVAEVGQVAEAASNEADRSRKLVPGVMDALHAQEMFRLLLPETLGGYEMCLPDYFHVMETLASFDASTAWCTCQGNCCAMTAGYMPLDIGQEIWGSDPRAVLAWGPGQAEAQVVDNGYRLTAKAAFASGSHYATWLGAHGSAVREADGNLRPGVGGNPEVRTLLFPAGETNIVETWDVMGLRGTGSDSYEVENLFVPEGHSVVRATMFENRPAHGMSTLYAFPQMSVHAIGFAATATGTARGFIDAFLQMAQTKTPRLHTSPLRDSPVVQDDVARAEARLSAGRAWLMQEAQSAWQEVEEQASLSIRQRNRIRLAATHAIHEAKGAVDVLYDAAGTSAV